MKIQCDCGKYKAELLNFPKNTPGRLACYCDDCQRFAKKLGRADILDSYGGTEVVPVYPNDVKIIEGEEYLVCNKLSRKGLHRWSVSCCNTPIGNTMPRFPWFGIPHKLFTNADPGSLERLGKVRSRIKGKFKTAEAPFKISEDLKITDALVIAPFILKGMLLKKYSESPFLKEDGKTPVREPHYLD